MRLCAPSQRGQTLGSGRLVGNCLGQRAVVLQLVSVDYYLAGTDAGVGAGLAGREGAEVEAGWGLVGLKVELAFTIPRKRRNLEPFFPFGVGTVRFEGNKGIADVCLSVCWGEWILSRDVVERRQTYV